eukprot:m.262713 g.262713  ORF g.262713 m.262713 type:complete len:56 (+) comp26806_c0_seq6:2278-2445(+)
MCCFMIDLPISHSFAYLLVFVFRYSFFFASFSFPPFLVRCLVGAVSYTTVCVVAG